MAAEHVDAVREVFELARRARHVELRARLHEDITWHPAREGVWRPCTNAEQVVRTLVWRAEANRLRPGELLDLGSTVFVQLRGRRLDRLGGRGFVPKLFQLVVIRDGRIASIQDYAHREDALAAAGVRP